MSAKVGNQPFLDITLRQAEALVAFFGGHDGEVTVMERPAEWTDMEVGLYAYCTEYPDEGCEFLGATEVDDELADKGRPFVDPRLIAAAPDLLTALGSVLSDLLEANNAHGLTDEFCEQILSVREARAAIAKATGEPA